MLVLSRRLSEVVTVTLADGRLIHFEICRIDRRQVRVGITAPADCLITRGREPIEGRKNEPVDLDR